MPTYQAKNPQLKVASLIKTKMFVGGKWLERSKTFSVEDPATGHEITKVADGDENDAKEAIEVARKAQIEFAKVPPVERGYILSKWGHLVRQNQEDLAKILAWENGKAWDDANDEILNAAKTFEWFAHQANVLEGDTLASQSPDVRIHTIRQPIGVCGIITAWNFPSELVSRKMGAAVAAGCAAVLKPAAETPLSALALAHLGQEAGLPDGIFNVITSNDTKPIGKELTTNPIVKKVSFTGSTGVGATLMEQSSSTVKKCSFELGGNAPFIVFKDADLKKAVKGAVEIKFGGTGQICIAANRFYIQEDIYDEFVKLFVEKVEELKPGSAFDKGTSQGPLIKKESVDKVKEHVEDALDKGGKLLTGGKELTDVGPNFYAPTVIGDCDPHKMKVFSEETFGPLAALAKFKTEEEAIELANDTELGLASYFYTENLNQAIRVSEALQTGVVGVNNALITEPPFPFGGIKQSGFGRELSKYGLEDYLVLKSVSTYIGE